MHRLLKSLEDDTSNPVIWCGDLNVAHNEIDIFGASKAKEKQAGFTPQERASFGDFLKESGFVDSFRHLHSGVTKYSYWNVRSGAREKNQGWRLDYIVASKGIIDKVVSSEINTEFMGSDHCPVSCEFVC